MASVTKKIVIDVAKENIFQAIIAKQNDSNSRFLEVTITNDGEEVSIEQSALVTINAKRDDGEARAFCGVVNRDGTVTVPLTNWMLSAEGSLQCDISVTASSGTRLTTTSFRIEVEASSYSGNDIGNDDEYDLLTSLIVECAAISESESSRVAAEQDRVSAEAQRQELAGNLRDGKSAYELAVDNGYEGTVEQWLESIGGEKGDVGDDGGYYAPSVTDGILTFTPSKVGMPAVPESDIRGPRGYSGMMPKATSNDTSGDVEIPVSTEFIIPALTGDTQLSLATPTQEEANYAVMWTCVIEQGETAYDVVLPAVYWTLGIAPTFAENTKTKIWLTADGDSIQGVWQAWSV